MDNTKEPLSGVTGNISQGEPFDAGNLEFHQQDRINKTLDPTASSASTSLGPSDTDVTTTSSSEDISAKSAEEETQMSPDDLTGPGPRTLEEIARENGGDAGNVSHNTSATSIGDKNAIDGPNSHEEKGTGEKYIKSTGLQADGGDFDATRAGAGREADRLMAEKGMRNDDGEIVQSSSSGGTAHEEKTSVIDKIKEKLHMH